MMDVMTKVAVAFFMPFALLIVNLIARYLLLRVIPNYTDYISGDIFKGENIFKDKRKLLIYYLVGFLLVLGISLVLP